MSSMGPATLLITENRVDLQEILTTRVNNVLDHSHQQQVLNHSDCRTIRSTPCPVTQMRHLIDLIIGLGEVTCNKFLLKVLVPLRSDLPRLNEWMSVKAEELAQLGATVNQDGALDPIRVLPVAEVFTVLKQELTKIWENSLFAKMKTIEDNMKETHETIIRKMEGFSNLVLKEGVVICQNCANVNVSGQSSAELLVPPKDIIVLSNQLTPPLESQISKTTPTPDVFAAFSENEPDQTAMDTSDDSAAVEEELAFHCFPVPMSKLSPCQLENVETNAALASGAPGTEKVSPVIEATAAEAAARNVFGAFENRQRMRERKQKSPTKKKGTIYYHTRDHQLRPPESPLRKKMKPMQIQKRRSRK